MVEHAVNWIVERAIGLIVSMLDMFSTSFLRVLAVDLTVFRNIFPIINTTYVIFLTTAVTLIILGLMWGIFKNFWIPAGFEAEDPIKLTIAFPLFIDTYSAMSKATL